MTIPSFIQEGKEVYFQDKNDSTCNCNALVIGFVDMDTHSLVTLRTTNGSRFTAFVEELSEHAPVQEHTYKLSGDYHTDVNMLLQEIKVLKKKLDK